MSAVKPMAVEDWLRNLALASKTTSHLRSLMHMIFQCAERWELIEKNPIKLVRVKGGTKRLKTPRVLAPEQFHSVVATDPGTVPDHGADCRVSGPAGQRDRCTSMAGLRFLRTHTDETAECGSWQGWGREGR